MPQFHLHNRHYYYRGNASHQHMGGLEQNRSDGTISVHSPHEGYTLTAFNRTQALSSKPPCTNYKESRDNWAWRCRHIKKDTAIFVY